LVASAGRGGVMGSRNERTIANLEIVLDEACSAFPADEGHDRRRYIADKLKQRAIEIVTI
jgi:hypothetical protein